MTPRKKLLYLWQTTEPQEEPMFDYLTALHEVIAAQEQAVADIAAEAAVRHAAETEALFAAVEAGLASVGWEWGMT